MIELAQDFDVHPNRFKQWRDQLIEGATRVYGEAPKVEPEPVIDVNALHAKIVALTFLSPIDDPGRSPRSRDVGA